MNIYSLLALTALAGMLPSGCWFVRPEGPTPPPLTEPPTLETLVRGINDNTAKVRSLESDQVTVAVQGMPVVARGRLALERPRRFRLQAGLLGIAGGPDVDIGSNDELFWVWTKWNEPPAVYFGRHDEFHRGAARQYLPIEPERLIEALGLVEIDPRSTVEGPFPHGEGQLEIRAREMGANGELVRVLLVDAGYGQVLEQHIYDASGNALVHVRAEDHRYYPEPGVSLPSSLVIQVPGSRTLRLDVGGYMVNRLTGDPAQLWSLPRAGTSPPINLADPAAFPPASANYGTDAAPESRGPAYPAEHRPRYRGVTPPR